MSFGAIAGLAGGLLQAGSARSAARAQENAANRQIEFQQGIYDQQTELFEPYRNAGTNALAAYMFDMGMGEAPVFGGAAPEITTVTTPSVPVASGPGMHLTRGGDQNFTAAPRSNVAQYQVGGQTFNTLEEAQAWADANRTGGTTYGGYTASPGYQWQLEQGQSAIDGSAASRGSLFSGATLAAQQRLGQGLAEQDRSTHMNRLLGLAGMGQSSVAQQATAAQNLGTGVTNALGSIGNAQAAGAIGTGNALSGMMNGLGSWYGYQNAANGGGNAGIGSTPWAGAGILGVDLCRTSPKASFPRPMLLELTRSILPRPFPTKLPGHLIRQRRVRQRNGASIAG